eukprot:120081-Pleurochrysis_carterae.AAC.1
MPEAEAPSTTSRGPRQSLSPAVGSASLESDSFRGSIVDVPSEFRVPFLPDSHGASSSLFSALNSPVKQMAEEILQRLYPEEFVCVKAHMT